MAAAMANGGKVGDCEVLGPAGWQALHAEPTDGFLYMRNSRWRHRFVGRLLYWLDIQVHTGRGGPDGGGGHQPDPRQGRILRLDGLRWLSLPVS